MLAYNLQSNTVCVFHTCTPKYIKYSSDLDGSLL